MDPCAMCCCGHVLDEHDGAWACAVPGCPCVYFEEELSVDPRDAQAVT